MLRPHMLLAALVLLSLATHAAEPRPEIQRPIGIAQAVGTVHTVRVIPEACVRLEGRFTGNAASPYGIAAVTTSPRCRPRARLVDVPRDALMPEAGWTLNDVIRIPSAECRARQAVIRVWRKDVDAQPPKADAQGRSRIYLKQGLDAAKAGQLGAIPTYAVTMGMAGSECE